MRRLQRPKPWLACVPLGTHGAETSWNPEDKSQRMAPSVRDLPLPNKKGVHELMNLGPFSIPKPQIMALALALLASPWALSQQTSYTGVGNVETTIIEQVLSVASVQNLSFGSIFPISTPESVTLTNPTNSPNQPPVVTVTNTNLLVVDSPTLGIWDIAGVPNALVSVTLPADGTISIDDGAGNSMAVDTFGIRSGAGGSLNLNLNSSGAYRFSITATLSVGANQPAGAYSGTYPITVNYQ